MAAAIIGLQLGAFAVVLETLFSGKTELPFSTFVLLMQPIHLAIGMVEGLVTAAVISFVWKARPEIMERASLNQALGGGLKVAGEVITQARHHEHLRQCLTYLGQAGDLLAADEKPPWELVALELAAAIHELGQITGEEVGEAILDRIFGQFCLGK